MTSPRCQPKFGPAKKHVVEAAGIEPASETPFTFSFRRPGLIPYWALTQQFSSILEQAEGLEPIIEQFGRLTPNLSAKPAYFLVGAVGVEPTRVCLRGSCSAG